VASRRGSGGGGGGRRFAIMSTIIFGTRSMVFASPLSVNLPHPRHDGTTRRDIRLSGHTWSTTFRFTRAGTQ